MKLVTFETKDAQRHIGALVRDGEVVDFTASSPAAHFRDMLALIDAGPAALDEARRLSEGDGAAVVRPAADVRLLAPVPEPRQMRDCLCFEKHLKQARASALMRSAPGQPVDLDKIEIPPVWYKQPIYYKANRFSVIGPEHPIEWPRYCKLLDYEMEFCIFTGKSGKNISRDRAREHVFGYSIFNDMSARDAQAEEMAGQLGPAKGKDFDTGNIIGPWLVTADEVPDPYNLEMIVRINGEERSRGNSGEMHHKFEDILAHISQDETIHAGEFFGSGTVGNGCGLELGRYLEGGDVIELEVTGLGVLRNTLGPRP